MGEREGGRRSDNTGQAVTQFQGSICEAQQGQTDHDRVMTGTGAEARSGPRMELEQGLGQGWVRTRDGAGAGSKAGEGLSRVNSIEAWTGRLWWGSRGRWEVRVGALSSGEVVKVGARTGRHGS